MTTTALIDLMVAVWLALVGACVGSFLNVVAYRMPKGMSVVWKPSHCPHCGHAIRARDNIPVLGWLVLRGRCRDCSSPISPRYALVEALTGVLFFVLAYGELLRFGANLPGRAAAEFTSPTELLLAPDWQLIALYAYHCTLVCLLMAVALVHLDGHRVPRRFAWLGVALAVVPILVVRGLHPLPPGILASRLHLVGTELADAALGIALGVCLGWIGTAIPPPASAPPERRIPAKPATANPVTTGLVLVGGFLGPLALASTTSIAIALIIVTYPLATKPKRTLFTSALCAAALLQIVAWKEIAILTPW